MLTLNFERDKKQSRKDTNCLTIQHLALACDDLVTQRALPVIPHDDQLPPLQLVLLKQRLTPHLYLLDLQLMHLQINHISCEPWQLVLLRNKSNINK